MKIILFFFVKALLFCVSSGVVLLSMIWFYYDLGFEKVVVTALAFIISWQLVNSKWVNKF